MQQRRRQLIGRGRRGNQLGIGPRGNHLRLPVEADHRGFGLVYDPFIVTAGAMDVGQDEVALASTETNTSACTTPVSSIKPSIPV
jgi:hypothetical protein